MLITQRALVTLLLLPCLAASATVAPAASHAHSRHVRCAQHATAHTRPICPAARRSGMVGIKQVPPHILRRTPASGLDEKHRRHARRTPRPDLVESLQTPPNAATTPVLDEANIPALPGVPPIVFVQPNKSDRERAIRSQQQP